MFQREREIVFICVNESKNLCKWKRVREWQQSVCVYGGGGENECYLSFENFVRERKVHGDRNKEWVKEMWQQISFNAMFSLNFVCFYTNVYVLKNRQPIFQVLHVSPSIFFVLYIRCYNLIYFIRRIRLLEIFLSWIMSLILFEIYRNTAADKDEDKQWHVC